MYDSQLSIKLPVLLLGLLLLLLLLHIGYNIVFSIKLLGPTYGTRRASINIIGIFHSLGNDTFFLGGGGGRLIKISLPSLICCCVMYQIFISRISWFEKCMIPIENNKFLSIYLFR